MSIYTSEPDPCWDRGGFIGLSLEQLSQLCDRQEAAMAAMGSHLHLSFKAKQDSHLAIYITCHLGLFTHKEIGWIFGVGYTSIPGALKRARSCMDSDKRLKKKNNGILSDI